MSILGDKVFFGGAGVAPVLFEYDGFPVKVEQDTANSANNRGNPSLLFIDVDGLQETVHTDTADHTNNINLPVEDLTSLAVLEEIRDNVVGNDVPLAVLYHDAGVAAIPVAPIVIGSIAANGKSIAVQNNANSVMVAVDGVDVGASLAGQTLSLHVDMAIGNITIRSLVGATISGGDIAINIMG